MANTEGLQKTLEHIKEHPGEWDQHRWSSCFAGISLRVLKGAQLSESDCCNLCRDLMSDGKPLAPHEIAEAAQVALELTDEQRSALFCSSWELDDLTRLVAEFTADEVPAAG